MVVQPYSGDSGKCKKTPIKVYTLERDKSLLQTLWLYTKKIYDNQIKLISVSSSCLRQIF